MIIQEEYYLKHALETKMNEFLEEELTEGEMVGWIPDNLARLMTECAYQILATVRDVNNYMQKEHLLK